MSIFQYGIVLCFLGCYAVSDLRTCTVPAGPAMFLFLAGLAVYALHPSLSIKMYAAGVVPGLMIYALSVLTKERIGKGDALTLAVCGSWLGLRKTLELLYLALLLATAAGMISLVKGKKLSTKMPFVPFLFGALIWQILCQ